MATPASCATRSNFAEFARLAHRGPAARQEADFVTPQPQTRAQPHGGGEVAIDFVGNDAQFHDAPC